MAKGKAGIGGIGAAAVEPAPIDLEDIEDGIESAIAPQPPIDNDHVAKGATLFTDDEIALNKEPSELPVNRKELNELGGAVQQAINAVHEIRTALGQAQGQIQQLETYVPQIQHSFAMADARMTAIAQQVARNVRSVALDLAIKAASDAQRSSPKLLVDAATTFMEFLDPPAPIGFAEEPPAPVAAPTTH